MSVELTIVKFVASVLGKTLVQSFGFRDNLTNNFLEQIIDTGTNALPERKEGQILEQQTQQLANTIKKQMQLLFAAEARNLKSNSQEAISWAVVETLLQSNLSLHGLVDIGLDTERLTQHLLVLEADLKLTVGFSPDEKSLYQQAIRFTSAKLIEMTPDLKGFELSVNQAILQQIEELKLYVRSLTEKALQQSDQFLARYRKIIAAELDKPDKFGVPLLKEMVSQQSLSEAYVHLSLIDTTEESPDESLLRGKQLSLFPQQNFQKRSIEELLSKKRRLVIRGDAGAGKTSLMQWLAVHTARQDFKPPFQNWNSRVPFFIRLRHWVDNGFPAVKDFVLPIAKNISDEMPSGWVGEQLRKCYALVLIDGIDELPRSKRQQFFEDLQRLVRDSPDAIYIVTSRPGGLKDENGNEWVEWENWIKAEKFSNCVMQPMNLPEIDQFVRLWHSSLPKPSGYEHKNPQQVGNKLMHQLHQRPEIRQLAATPLLCTMICALHYNNEGNLPENRLTLYEKCIEMLLEERDRQREIRQDFQLNLQQKEAFLMKFAYWLMRNDYSDAELEKADNLFQHSLREYNLLPAMTGSDIRQLLLQRSGLLREPVIGRIDFVHRTFQEYLAAKAVLYYDDWGLLLERAENDQWREVIIVAVGKGMRPQQKQLLKGLLNRGGNNPAKRYYLHSLAMGCLETGVLIEAELRTQIEASVKALLPPKNDDEVATLARLGDLIVPFLAYNPQFSIREAEFSMTTLVKIGSPVAMKQLIDYAKARFDPKDVEFSTIPLILGYGYHVFDLETYLSQVLIHAQHLDLTRTKIEDLSFLSSLSQLQGLNLRGTAIKDLCPLSSLSQLRVLVFSSTKIEDLCPLSSLSQLRVLVFGYAPIQDLSPLSSLSQLEQLGLSSTAIQDLSPLSSLSQLEQLDLSSTAIQDLSPLSSLSQLEQLDLSSTAIQDLSPLSSLSQLEQLDLSYTAVQDLSPLLNLSQLKELFLRGLELDENMVLTKLSQKVKIIR